MLAQPQLGPGSPLLPPHSHGAVAAAQGCASSQAPWGIVTLAWPCQRRAALLGLCQRRDVPDVCPLSSNVGKHNL